jgi:hypothetical protein
MVHTDCLGFPGVDEVVAAIMPDWYWKMHLFEGWRDKLPQTGGPATPKGLSLTQIANSHTRDPLQGYLIW